MSKCRPWMSGQFAPQALCPNLGNLPPRNPDQTFLVLEQPDIQTVAQMHMISLYPPHIALIPPQSSLTSRSPEAQTNILEPSLRPGVDLPSTPRLGVLEQVLLLESLLGLLSHFVCVRKRVVAECECECECQCARDGGTFTA